MDTPGTFKIYILYFLICRICLYKSVLGSPCSWSWSYGSRIYNYLCNQCLSPLTLWVQIKLMRDVLDTTLCDKVSQWLVAGWWFSPGTLVSSTNKTDRHDITELLLKVALNTITLTLKIYILYFLICRICLYQSVSSQLFKTLSFA